MFSVEFTLGRRSASNLSETCDSIELRSPSSVARSAAETSHIGSSSGNRCFDCIDFGRLLAWYRFHIAGIGFRRS
jgi:hypothetical protein